jgi:hypothetical protein
MDDVEEIERILAAPTLRRADAREMMVFARKLTERVPAVQVRQYAHLKFFCDWALHTKIDRSKAGALVLANLHDIVADEVKNHSGKAAERLGETLSLERVRTDQMTWSSSLAAPPR